jgi:hypothetical protein
LRLGGCDSIGLRLFGSDALGFAVRGLALRLGLRLGGCARGLVPEGCASHQPM